MLSKDRFQRIRDLFEQALDQPADTRAQFLAAQTQGDTSLASEVASLLKRADDLDDSFLEPLTGHRIARIFEELAGSTPTPPHPPTGNPPES